MNLLASQSMDLLIQNWASGLGGPLFEHFLRLVVAGLAGGLVGLEREVRGRQAGFRTNLLVCLGSALVMLVSIQVAERPWPSPGNGVVISVDPARIAYGVMTGIGFLGAGTIIQLRGSVRGLTTAAGLWCVAAIGLASGLGLYVLTVVSTLMVLLALWLLQLLEIAMPHVQYRTVTVRRAWRPGCVAETVRRFQEAHITVLDTSFQRTPDLAQVDISLAVTFTGKQRFHQFQQQLEGDPQWLLLSVRQT